MFRFWLMIGFWASKCNPCCTSLFSNMFKKMVTRFTISKRKMLHDYNTNSILFPSWRLKLSIQKKKQFKNSCYRHWQQEESQFSVYFSRVKLDWRNDSHDFDSKSWIVDYLTHYTLVKNTIKQPYLSSFQCRK